MFDLIAKLLQKDGLKTYQQRLVEGPSLQQMGSTISYKYDPETERLYHEFMVETNQHKPKEVVVNQSLDEHLRKKLSRELKRDRRKIKAEILAKDSDSTLSVYLNNLGKQINFLIKRLHMNKQLKERPYIKAHLKRMVAFIKEVAPESLTPDFEELEQKVDGRGNPNFKKNEMSYTALIEIIDHANQCLQDDYNFYRGQNEDTLLSTSLGIELQEEFNIPESTIRDNIKKKCKKVGRLFKLKDAYK